MRYFCSICLLLLVVLGCSKSENRMLLTGEVKGLKKGTLVLQKFEDTLLISVDSVEIDGDPVFQLESEIDSPEMYYLYLRLKNGTLLDERIPFFAEPGEINIQTSLKRFGNDVRVSGSTNQEKLREYKALMDRYSNKHLELIEQAFEARQNKQDSLAGALTDRQNRVLAGKYLATVNFALNHKEYELAPYLMLSEVYDANIKYLDTVYSALGPEIKNSKYGRELANYIEARKKSE